MVCAQDAQEALNIVMTTKLDMLIADDKQVTHFISIIQVVVDAFVKTITLKFSMNFSPI